MKETIVNNYKFYEVKSDNPEIDTIQLILTVDINNQTFKVSSTWNPLREDDTDKARKIGELFLNIGLSIKHQARGGNNFGNQKIQIKI